MDMANLRLIEFDDIQLLRYWRNLDHVRSRMVRTDYIERDGQRNWYDRINEDSQLYYIFSIGSQDVGCANLTKIDYAKKSFEGGIFCGDPKFINHWINIWSCVKIYDYALFELDLHISFATILNDNRSALQLNKSLGYEHIEDVDENIGRFVLTRESYIHSTKIIRRYLQEFAKQNL
jgi:RimJ/RimL family protein N-acetyltransferase